MSELDIMKAASDAELKRTYLFRICKTRDELQHWIIAFLGLDLPDTIVYTGFGLSSSEESNSSPLDMVYELYSKMLDGHDEDFQRALYYASRDSFKTLGAAVVEVLALLHCNRSAAHMAAISEQALKSQEYVKRAFRRPLLRDYVVGDNERTTKIVRYYNPETQHSLTAKEYESLSSDDRENHTEIVRQLEQYIERENYVKIIICTMQGANSEHVPLLICDEIDVVANPAAYQEAQNIPAGRGGKLPITVLMSTRKQAFGLVQKEIDRAKEKDTGLKIRHWNIIDVTEACPPERYRPDLVKLTLYVNDDELRHVNQQGYDALTPKDQENFSPAEGFAGCENCKLFTACRTRLATKQTSKSLLLKSIPEVIGKFKANTIEMAKAQLLCLKPSSVGLIYGRFDKSKHVLTPAQAYEKIVGELPPNPKTYRKSELVQVMRERGMDNVAGLDWGHTHNFAFVQGWKEKSRLFITGALGIAGLDPDQMLDVCEPFKADNPKIFPDTADPKMIKLFKKYGYQMVKWKKTPGSVVGGINIVRWLLNPPMMQPNLYFVIDIDEDPYMTDLINAVAEYHWKKSVDGKPTDVPDEENDDGCDGLRYLCMNVFTLSGKIMVPRDIIATQQPQAPGGGPAAGYDPKNWVQQLIAERTGTPFEPEVLNVATTRPVMRVEMPVTGGGFRSYYSDADGKAPAPGPDNTPKKRGKKGRLTWDIS